MTPENEHLVDKECIVDRTKPDDLKLKLEETKAYLGRPALNIFMNTQRIDLTKFDNKTILNEATIT